MVKNSQTASHGVPFCIGGMAMCLSKRTVKGLPKGVA